MPDAAERLIPPSLADHIVVFRRFNRLYTRFIGTLREGLLNTEYSLAEARVLYELGARSSPKSKEIAEALSMDAGHLSRILAKLEQSALLKRKISEHDNRFADLVLTPRGRSVVKKLNDLSDQQACNILKPLLPADRTELIASMQGIEQILGESTAHPAPYVLRPPRVGDMGWVVSREGATYAEEYGWNEEFEGLVAQIVSDFLAHFDSNRERCWIAEQAGRSIGHVFLVKHPEQADTAKLRLLFVESAARGKGLGRALVNECILFARAAGYRRIVLWTQSILTSAQRIYGDAGFRLISEEPHHSFGKDLIGQTWELCLPGTPADLKPSGGQRCLTSMEPSL